MPVQGCLLTCPCPYTHKKAFLFLNDSLVFSLNILDLPTVLDQDLQKQKSNTKNKKSIIFLIWQIGRVNSILYWIQKRKQIIWRGKLNFVSLNWKIFLDRLEKNWKMLCIFTILNLKAAIAKGFKKKEPMIAEMTLCIIPTISWKM